MLKNHKSFIAFQNLSIIDKHHFIKSLKDNFSVITKIYYDNNIHIYKIILEGVICEDHYKAIEADIFLYFNQKFIIFYKSGKKTESDKLYTYSNITEINRHLLKFDDNIFYITDKPANPIKNDLDLLLKIQAYEIINKYHTMTIRF